MPKNISKKPFLVPGPKARLRQGTFEKPRYRPRNQEKFKDTKKVTQKCLSGPRPKVTQKLLGSDRFSHILVVK